VGGKPGRAVRPGICGRICHLQLHKQYAHNLDAFDIGERNL
jgi:hypothetical protein